MAEVVTPSAVIAVFPPGAAVTVKPVMALPPSLVGAVQLTVACAWPGLANTAVGTPGAVGVAGVTAFDAADSRLLPTLLVAWTVKV